MLQKLIISLFALGTIGCSAPVSLGKNTSGSGCVGEECVVAQAKAKATVGVVKQSQILPALASCLGLPADKISAGTKTRMKGLKKLFSASGNVKDVSAPMLMAQLELSGDICGDLIEYEKSTKRNFFTGFKIGTFAQEQVDLSTVINKFSSACWGRAAFSAEVEKIKSNWPQGFSSKYDESAALFICSAMLAAPDVLAY